LKYQTLGRPKPALQSTLPPEIVDELQNHFLAGILAPMQVVVIQFRRTKPRQKPSEGEAVPPIASPASGHSS